MSSALLATVSIFAAYLLGAIPFAFLVAFGIKGIDIRTVGSGNVGATNVGRVMGFRYFLLVFVLDLLKGYLPTWGLPRLVARATGVEVAGLAVLVALATILGHNFPVYLKFKGGKGVATSLGAMAALDPFASAATASAFVAFIFITRYVSLSSALGACVFFVVHFGRTPRPFDRQNLAMTLLTVALLGMLLMRHRKNFARIAAGTEPKVGLGKRRSKLPPSGRVRPIVVAGLATLGVAVGLGSWLLRSPTLDCGDFTLVPAARAATGHQRADRLTFADGGKLLAVGCPRYNRVVLYRVTGDQTLELVRDIPLEGRAVAIRPASDRLYVLQRPTGDAHHVEAGYWETFDFRGQTIGERFRVGFDPDDLALSPDGRRAFVLLSGHAEGETNRPSPCLAVFDLEPKTPRATARVDFNIKGDDPDRLTLSSTGARAVVTLRGTDQIAAIDLSDPDRPEAVGRVPWNAAERSFPSLTERDWLLMPPAPDREAAWVCQVEGALPRVIPTENGPMAVVPRRSYLIETVPDGSGLEVAQAASRKRVGLLPIRGSANLGGIRPSGLAYSPERGLLAVANRQGGSVHLIAIRSARSQEQAPEKLAVLGE